MPHGEDQAALRFAPDRLDPVELVEQRSGAPAEEVSAFFAKGMLLTISMAMKLFDEPTPWGDRLIAGCFSEETG